MAKRKMYAPGHEPRKPQPGPKPVPGATYYTHAHNIDGCLRNGSYVRKDKDGKIVQYMNGDYMGEVAAIPTGMTEVDATHARNLLPKVCK